MATTTGPSLYRSTDGGNTWAAVPNQPTGLMPLSGALDGSGQLFLAYDSSLGPNGVSNSAVYRLATASNTWTNFTPLAPGSWQFGYGAVGVSASNPGEVMVSTLDRWSADDIYRSTDGGNTWTGMSALSNHSAPNNPWEVAYFGGSLGTAMGGWLTSVALDPFNSNHVMYTGLWESTNAMSNAISWSYNNSGIEERLSCGRSRRIPVRIC